VSGVGSDTGGSVRVPSAWNDLVGLKTTAGRLSLKGVVPLSETFDTVGPLCRTVLDASLMLSVLEDSKPADLTNPSLTNTNILVIENVIMDDLSFESQKCFDQVINILKSKRANIVSKKMPEIEEVMSLGGSLVTTEAYGTWYELIEKKPDVMFSKILDRFRSGNSISGAEYVDLWRKLKIVRQKFYNRILPYDFVIMPTAPILPPNMNRLLNDDEYYVSQNLMALRNTRLCNFLGGCALTIPTNVPSNGIMLMGFPNTEEKLLRYGALIESALQD